MSKSVRRGIWCLAGFLLAGSPSFPQQFVHPPSRRSLSRGLTSEEIAGSRKKMSGFIFRRAPEMPTIEERLQLDLRERSIKRRSGSKDPNHFHGRRRRENRYLHGRGEAPDP